MVLICDDDKSIREVVAALLEHRGYRVIAVGTAQEVLEQASALKPSVILLNLIMPDMDGWAAMAALKKREDTKDIPVVIFSVLSPEEAKVPVTGVDGWVRKPLNEESLFGALKRSIAQHDGVAKILLVEDDLGLARVLTTMLERDGMEIFHARTAAEAIQLSQHLLPDLLILDLISPEDDGLAVVEWLRHHNHLSQVTLVVYTVKDLDDADRERLKLGRTEFLSKGLDGPEEVERRVVDLLSQVVPKRGEDGRPDNRNSSDDRR